MSGMNFLEKLLDGVAVEWKPLGALGEFVRGSGLQKSDFTDSGIGCIHYGQIYTFYGDYAYQTKSFVSSTLATKLRKAQKSDLIIATTSENIEDVCKTLVWLGEQDVCVSGETYIFKHNQNPKYLAYYLKTPHFFDFKKRNRTGTKVIRVHGDRLATFQIPIPCPDNPDRSLAIQAEIVRILDTFTALTAELTAELTDRKKQYNYYRDRLLNFGDEVPVVQLSRCCVSIADGDHQAPPKTDMGIPFITISNVSNSYQIDFINTRFVSEAYYGGLDDKRKARKNDILYTVVGSLGIPVFIGDNRKFAFQRHIAILRPNGNVIIPKYLYHVLRSSDFLKQAYAVAVGAAQKTITLTALNRMKISMPPLEKQARIVALLDKFDTLTHSISEGLPREIALRQKQYEYYRDLLLTFPKPEEVKMHLATVEKSHE